jgi:YD repeat-containing protein
MVTFGNTTLTYDLHGNSRRPPIRSAGDVHVDVRNRLTGITATGLAASFTYDPLGQRVNKTINGAATRFL